jgi:hypothetical protein
MCHSGAEMDLRIFYLAMQFRMPSYFGIWKWSWLWRESTLDDLCWLLDVYSSFKSRACQSVWHIVAIDKIELSLFWSSISLAYAIQCRAAGLD